MEKKMLTVEDLLAIKPANAEALVCAELEQDDSDIMSDYHGTKTIRHVAIGWRTGKREDFRQLRRVAAQFAETVHLGPDCGVYTARVVLDSDAPDGNGCSYWKGSPSHWHSELYGDEYGGRHFTKRVDVDAFIASAPTPEPITFGDNLVTFRWDVEVVSIEHRENYSMGAGNYLKASHRYSSGWRVRSVSVAWLKSYCPIEDGCPRAVSVEADIDGEAGDGATISRNEEKNGVEIRFAAKPGDEVRAMLKANGWRWAMSSRCWYRKDTPDARASAMRIVARVGGAPAARTG